MKSIIQKNHHAVSFKATCMMVITLLMISVGVKAQTVHIGLDNGNLMNAVVPGNDSGWEPGFATLWRHEQLALSMMGSDRDGIYEESGLINYPSAVFGKHSKLTNNNKDYGITIVGGRRPSYIVVSLPKGYRITGYTIVLSNDLIGANMGSDRFSNINTNDEGISSSHGTMRFCEVKQWKTDGTNSGTNPRPDDESNSDGYNLARCRYINGGLNWETGGQIGSEVIEWAKDANGNIDIRTDEYNPNDPNHPQPKEYTLHRTAQFTNQYDENNQPIYDMGNNLFFRLVKDYCFYGITIKEFRIEFSAEGTFKADITPSAAGVATSAIGVPFTTSKIDIGEMRERSKTGSTITHYAFDSKEITNLVAYNWLYQDDAYENGIPADVANNKNIRPVEVDGQLLYALKSDTYFIETPIEIRSKNNTAPIGYRIVGAQFKPLWGNGTSVTTPGGTYHYITYTSGGKTYYLNPDGKFVETEEPTVWVSDNTGIHFGNEKYLARAGNYPDYYLTVSGSTVDNKLSLEVSNGHTYLYYQGRNTYYLQGTTSASESPQMTTSTGSDRAEWTTETVADKTETVFSPGSYKLKIYKRDGSGLIHWQYDNDSGYQQTDDTTKPDYIEISNESDPDIGKVIDMGSCNNDAIKFEIETTGVNAADHQALVQVTLLLQALDPYIDKMDIVCTDARKVLKLTQSFTADDFSVSGGKFIFYVPSDYKDEMLTFTFSDLYSKYGDETYYGGGTGFGRYCFVSSGYFDPINGDNNGGLYASTYNPNANYNAENASKVNTSTAGNIRFKFNNAEDLEEGGIQEEGAELEEYPFSVAIYKASTDPGDPLSATPHGPNENVRGKFDIVQLQASKADQHSGTYFVFTADETRWNIAPTTNWQHRFYAFYRMEIDLVARTFTPDFTLTKIYDSTLYEKDGKDAEDSMWGLKLDVADTDNNGEKVQGYLTYQEIIDIAKEGRPDIYYTQAECYALNATLTGAITSNTELTTEQANAVNTKLNLTGENAYKAGDKPIVAHANAYNATLSGAVTTSTVKAPAVPKILVDEAHAADGPTSMKQILYVDGTPLYAMLNSSQNSKVKTLEDLQDELAGNAIVFLPENTTSTLDNVAFVTSDESSNTSFFRAGKDIVLTDKQPFFTPYDIQVDAANHVTYNREKSGPTTNNLVKYATVVLPFTMVVNEGKHVNDPADGYEFNLRKLVDLSRPNNQVNNYYSEGNFQTISGSQTEANMPYMVEVTASPANNKYSFAISQKGSTIYATPYEKDTDGNITMGHKFFKGDTYNNELTNYGTYSGAKVAKGDNIYYFNKDKFYCSSTLTGSNVVNVRPFRAYYSPNANLTLYSKMIGFYVMYDLFSDDGGITTSLTETSKPRVMTIKTYKGSMLITAEEDIPVKIMSINGFSVDSFNMNAGEQRQVNLPSGIYLVNNTKILVK